MTTDELRAHQQEAARVRRNLQDSAARTRAAAATTTRESTSMSTSTDQFAPAAPPSGGIDLKAHLNALLLIRVHAVETGIQTTFGLNDAVRCDVTVLDGPHAGDEYTDTLIFPKVLQGQLKSKVGGMVLGRLGQGNAKPGQSAPWLLIEPNDTDKNVARQHLAKNANPPF